MLDETQKSQLWRALDRLDRREKREAIDRLRHALEQPDRAGDAPIGANDNRRSAYDIAKAAGVIGAISVGPADVSTNPKHMEGFGGE